MSECVAALLLGVTAAGMLLNAVRIGPALISVGCVGVVLAADALFQARVLRALH